MNNLIGIWANLSRAYEIALLGGFTIQVVFDKEYTQGFADYVKLKSFYGGVEFVESGDLIVEICKPKYTKPGYKKKSLDFETMSDIVQRVEVATKNKKPTEFENDSCHALLKTATDRLSLSLERVENVVEISKIIAQSDGSETIKLQHVAEAIQYNCHDYTTCNAENATINFGQGIEISLFGLDRDDIENAIQYLRELQTELIQKPEQ